MLVIIRFKTGSSECGSRQLTAPTVSLSVFLFLLILRSGGSGETRTHNQRLKRPSWSNPQVSANQHIMKIFFQIYFSPHDTPKIFYFSRSSHAFSYSLYCAEFVVELDGNNLVALTNIKTCRYINF